MREEASRLFLSTSDGGLPLVLSLSRACDTTAARASRPSWGVGSIDRSIDPSIDRSVGHQQQCCVCLRGTTADQQQHHQRQLRRRRPFFVLLVHISRSRELTRSRVATRAPLATRPPRRDGSSSSPRPRADSSRRSPSSVRARVATVLKKKTSSVMYCCVM